MKPNATPERGIAVDESDGAPLRCGNHSYWDAQFQQIVLRDLARFCPTVGFSPSKDGGGAFSAVFRQNALGPRELCADSIPISDRRARLAESEVEDFIRALDELHRKAEDESTVSDSARFIREFLVPDPREMPDAWRATSEKTPRLLVLWGFAPKKPDAAVKPLTETSKSWSDVKQRVDLRLAFREALAKNPPRPFPWLGCLLPLLLLTLLVACLAFGDCAGSFREAWGCVPTTTTTTRPSPSTTTTATTTTQPPLPLPTTTTTTTHPTPPPTTPTTTTTRPLPPPATTTTTRPPTPPTTTTTTRPTPPPTTTTTTRPPTPPTTTTTTRPPPTTTTTTTTRPPTPPTTTTTTRPPPTTTTTTTTRPPTPPTTTTTTSPPPPTTMTTTRPTPPTTTTTTRPVPPTTTTTTRIVKREIKTKKKDDGFFLTLSPENDLANLEPSAWSVTCRGEPIPFSKKNGSPSRIFIRWTDVNSVDSEDKIKVRVIPVDSQGRQLPSVEKEFRIDKRYDVSD